jgi:hypothetical protein
MIGSPRCSMYGIFTNICPKNHPNVGKYAIHGSYGSGCWFGTWMFCYFPIILEMSDIIPRMGPVLNAEIHVLDKHQEVQDGWNIHVMGMEFATWILDCWDRMRIFHGHWISWKHIGLRQSWTWLLFWISRKIGKYQNYHKMIYNMTIC